MRGFIIKMKNPSLFNHHSCDVFGWRRELGIIFLTASIGAVICGACAGAITIVSSQEINSGWSNIDSWNVFKETGVGLVSGAISGLGTSIGTSILTGGIFQITSGLFVSAYIVLNHEF